MKGVKKYMYARKKKEYYGVISEDTREIIANQISIGFSANFIDYRKPTSLNNILGVLDMHTIKVKAGLNG